jgi:putative oxidoreductase
MRMTGIGKLLLRATVGGYFVGHGLQKLTGAFGGDGLDKTGKTFEKLGLKPGRENAILAGAAETGGGALLTLGLLTPFASSALAGVMTNAIRHVHGKNGPWIQEGGFEHPAVVLAALAALAESGPGPLSLDTKLGTEIKGPVAMTLAVGAGAAAAVFVAKRGEEVFDRIDADSALSRMKEYVGAAS